MIDFYKKENLERVMKGDVFGNFEPYLSGDSTQVENFLKKIRDKIKINTKLSCIENFNHFGSGYASYVVLDLFKKNNPLYEEKIYQISNAEIKNRFKHAFKNPETAPELKLKQATINEVSMKCLSLAINRHMPVAVFGETSISQNDFEGKYYGGSSSMMGTPYHSSEIMSVYGKEIAEVKKILDIYSITLLENEEDLSTVVDTDFPIWEKNINLNRSKAPTIYDCLFYWMD